jgi:citrate lyase subunit beta / citryl-CoA lyase
MDGLWYKQVEQGRRFVIRLAPGESLRQRLAEFAGAAGVRNAVVVSAVGSVRDVQFRGIRSGAALPLTAPRMHAHDVAGPLELLAVTGGLVRDQAGAVDCHLHVTAARSSGEVLGGHLFDARVFATCEIVLSELLAEQLDAWTFREQHPRGDIAPPAPAPRPVQDRLRRSLLYVPGNMPSMLQNIPIFQADVVIIDLEDAVPHFEKDAARRLVRRFLEGYRERDKEILVRINALDTPFARDDLREVLPARPDGVRLPKADTPELVERLDTTLTEFEESLGLPVGTFLVLPSIESALGVSNCMDTASASDRLLGLAFGAEDYTATLEVERTKGGEELLIARSRVVRAAKAVGIQAIDSIFADVNDVEGLRRETELVKGLGYVGKSLVNPRQIAVVHEVFAPKATEIAYAREVVDAIRRARELGTGVIALRGKMVDAPVVKRALRVLRTAHAQGLIDDLPEEDVHHGA